MRIKETLSAVLILGFSALLFVNFGEQVSGYMNFEEALQSGETVHAVGAWAEKRSTNLL